MNRAYFSKRYFTAGVLCSLALLITAGALASRSGRANGQEPFVPKATQASDSLLDRFRQVEVASLSDAAEQILHRRAYLSHRMQAVFPTRFAGYAVTVSLKLDEGNKDPNALNGMMAAIDQGGRDSVYVMSVENGADIAGMGGLMCTTMHARGYAGAVIDGGVRDIAQLRRIGFPVYALGPVPSTSIGHYKFGGANVRIVCDGVPVEARDLVAADLDGVVIIPRDKAEEILTLAEQMDFKEHSMYPIIEKYKSLEEAVRKFGRL